MRRIAFPLAAAALLAAPAALAGSKQGGNLIDRMIQYASQPTVVFQPPAGRPSPMAGSFVVPYQGDDESRQGTYMTASSTCSDKLVFEDVPTAESRKELFSLETGIGINLGLNVVQGSGGFNRKSLAGMEYEISNKRIIVGGMQELEECCVQSPERCTNEIIAEWWQGNGKVHRFVNSNANLRINVKQLERVGRVDFGNTQGWSMQNNWNNAFFAYRTQAVRIPSCEEFMNNSPELDDKVRFTGVSKLLPAEQTARRDARDDARQQLVEFLGSEYRLVGDQALRTAEALISGIKDDLTCVDQRAEPTGPHYLARVRMYVDKSAVDAATATMRSTTGGRR